LSARQWGLCAVSVTIDVVLVQDKTLAAADLDGRVVVLSVRAGAYFGFNGIASEIWHMLSKPCRVGEIFDALSQSHDVDASTLSRDVLPFLQTLIEQGLARQIDRDSVR
jgi:hypothetical protein